MGGPWGHTLRHLAPRSSEPSSQRREVMALVSEMFFCKLGSIFQTVCTLTLVNSTTQGPCAQIHPTGCGGCLPAGPGSCAPQKAEFGSHREEVGCSTLYSKWEAATSRSLKFVLKKGRVSDFPEGFH